MRDVCRGTYLTLGRAGVFNSMSKGVYLSRPPSLRKLRPLGLVKETEPFTVAYGHGGDSGPDAFNRVLRHVPGIFKINCAGARFEIQALGFQLCEPGQ